MNGSGKSSTNTVPIIQKNAVMAIIRRILPCNCFSGMKPRKTIRRKTKIIEKKIRYDCSGK